MSKPRKTTVIGVRMKREVYDEVCREAEKDSRTIGAEAGVLLKEAMTARRRKGRRRERKN